MTRKGSGMKGWDKKTGPGGTGACGVSGMEMPDEVVHDGKRPCMTGKGQGYLVSKYFQQRALQAAPTSGAQMNTHTSERAWPPAKMAGPMERAGLTEVPVRLMHTR